jgi:voltage-gated potassium channel
VRTARCVPRRDPYHQGVAASPTSGAPRPPETRAARVDRHLRVPTLVAALVVIPALVLQQLDTTDARAAGDALYTVIWIVFAVELVATLAVADDRRRWTRTHLLEIAIVALTAPYAPTVLQVLRAGRVWQAVRLLRVLQLVRTGSLARRAFSLDGLRWAAVIALLVVVAGGYAFAELEQEPGISSGDGVWWAITTMTTVGYGDYTPHTLGGRAIAVAVMIVGIGFVGILTGAIAERFVRHAEAAEAQTLSLVVDRLDALDARLERIESILTAGRSPD